MELKKTYISHEQDYYRLNLYYAKKRYLGLNAIMFVFMLIIVFLSFDFSAAGNMMIPYIILVVVCVSAFIGLLYAINILILRTICKRQYRSSKALQAEAEITINDEGILKISSVQTSMIKWPDVYKACEDKYAIYFFESKLMAVILPKVLLDTQEIVQLKTLASKYLDSKQNRFK